MLRILPEARNILTFSSLDGGKIKGGKIWIYPLGFKLPVDASSKINKKYTIYYEAEASEEFNYNSLNYNITNSGEDKTLYITYEKNFKDKSIEFKNMEYPFKICFDFLCIETPNIVPFEAHQQGTFRAQLEKRTIGNKLYYILPAHSINPLIPKKLEYDVEKPFNKDNNVFRLENTNYPTFFLIYVNTDNKILNTTYYSKNLFPYNSRVFKSPGGGWVLDALSSSFHGLVLSSPEGDEKGTIWIHPLKETITIDLSKKIEKKITIESYGMFDPLTYSVSNLAKDRKVKFNYQKEYKDDEGETIKLSNPFMICKGEDCQENVESYEFKKGESYTIGVKFLNQTGRYFLPAFSFDSNAGFLSLSLIYLALLLIL